MLKILIFHNCCLFLFFKILFSVIVVFHRISVGGFKSSWTTHLSRGILWEKCLKLSFKPQTDLQWWVRKASKSLEEKANQRRTPGRAKKINPSNNEANKSFLHSLSLLTANRRRSVSVCSWQQWQERDTRVPFSFVTDTVSEGKRENMDFPVETHTLFCLFPPE